MRVIVPTMPITAAEPKRHGKLGLAGWSGDSLMDEDDAFSHCVIAVLLATFQHECECQDDVPRALIEPRVTAPPQCYGDRRFYMKSISIFPGLIARFVSQNVNSITRKPNLTMCYFRS